METYCKVTVLILTKNPGNIIKDVISAVLKQITSWNYDVLVIDSGSSDGTVDYLNGFDQVRVHQIDSSDFGHGKTRNLGISLSNSEYVALLTHDACPASDDWLQSLVDSVDNDETIAGAFGRHLSYDDANPFVRRDLQLHFDGFLNWPSVFRLEDKARYADDQGYRQILHFFSDNNSLVRKSVWEKIPYPNVNFAEDQIWAKQIIEAGYGKAYSDSGAVYHSHNYTLKQTLYRSFDEASAMRRLFGYKLCCSLSDMFKQIWKCSVRDVSYVLRTEPWKGKVFWGGMAPLLNVSQQVGFYLGCKYYDSVGGVRALFSLDNRLKNS